MSREADPSTHMLMLQAATLNPAALQRRWREWERGGLPSSSIPSGSAGRETPLPLPDRVDQRLAADRKRYKALLEDAQLSLARALRLQNAWLLVAPPPPEMVTALCENPACTNELELNRKSGECRRCRVWRHRHQLAYPLLRTA